MASTSSLSSVSTSTSRLPTLKETWGQNPIRKDSNSSAVAVKKRETKRPSLPLGWTQVKRKRKRNVAESSLLPTPNKDNDEGDWNLDVCCNDPACVNVDSVSRKKKLHFSDSEDTLKEVSGNNVEIQTNKKKTTVTLKGTAIFCLHELDPPWFQGQFVPSSSNKPIGLLAVQRDDIDDCLRCADGGYRELDVTIYDGLGKSKNNNRNNNNEKNRKKLKLERVKCTGGDMLRFRTEPTTANKGNNDDYHPTVVMEFDADRILTGKRSLSFVERYFASLVKKVRLQNNNGKEKLENRDLLDLLPELAVVIGTMSLAVPTSFAGGDTSRDGAIENDDWMSD